MKDYLIVDLIVIIVIEVKWECLIVFVGDYGLGICFNDYNCYGLL